MTIFHCCNQGSITHGIEQGSVWAIEKVNCDESKLVDLSSIENELFLTEKNSDHICTLF